MATTLQEWMRNGSSLDSIMVMLAMIEQEGNRNNEAYIRRNVSVNGLDPSVWAAYDARKGSKTTEQMLQDSVARDIRAGDAVRSQISSGALAPSGRTWEEENRVNAQNATATAAYNQRLASMGTSGNVASGPTNQTAASLLSQSSPTASGPTAQAGSTDVTRSSGSYPTTNLQPGSTGPEVQRLQDYLVSIGYMTQAEVNTGYGTYGPRTTAAVQRLQQDLGVDNSSGPGYFGPRTIAALNGAFAQTSPTQQSQQTQPVPEGDLMTELDGFLQQMQANGQVLNPNIELTPDKVAEFLAQAEREINPYYQGQLRLARESLLSSTGYSRDEVVREEERLEQKYGTRLRELGETSAERGFAQSGLRQRDERQLATDTQNTIEDTRRKLSFDAANEGRQFAQRYGTTELPNFDIGETPTVRAGESRFSRSGGTRSLYQLSPDIYQGLIGSEEFNRRGAVSSRASGLEEAFRTGQSINQQRQLVI